MVLGSAGGLVLAVNAGLAVFATYYIGLVAGESLADRLLVSPFVAMWTANALLLAAALLAALLAALRSSSHRAARGAESLGIGG